MIKPKLNITFHNPNSNDEVVKFLVKIIAQQKVNELISAKQYIPEPQM